MSYQEYREAVRKRHADAHREAEAILDRATAEHRDLRPDEAARADALIEKVKTAADILRRMDDEEARMAEADRLRAPLAAALGGYTATTGYSDGATLRRAFSEAKDGRATAFESDLSPEFRTLTSPGGSAIPTTFYDGVVMYQRTMSPILRVASVLSSTSGAPITLPRLTADINYGGTVVAEAAGLSLLDPTISSVTLGAFKYGAIVRYSAELDLDNVVGLEDLIARSTARELTLDYANHLTNGTGTTQPWGYLTRASLAGTAQGTAVTGGASYVGWQDAADLYGSVASGYQGNGTFLCSPTAFTAALKWADTSGRPIIETGLGDGSVRLFGRPVYVDPALPTLGSASKSWVFGDFAAGYYIHRVTPARIEGSREAYFGEDLVGLKVVERIDGDLVDTAAVKALVSANT